MEITTLLNSNECKVILKKIATENDFRMCLNKNVITSYQNFFGNVIMLNFVFDILPSDLNSVYEDVKGFVDNQCCKLLNIKSIKGNSKKVEALFNKILGTKKFIFHGTTSSQEINLRNLQNCVQFVKEYYEAINNIYEKHNVYMAFQSGLRDFNKNNFWATTFPRSAVFYSLQSPEFFARFASRSDFYKADIFQYDRIAYYRKDFGACKQNLIREMREFKFNKSEIKIVLNNFKKMWNIIVEPEMKNIILYKVIKANNKQHFNENMSPYEMLLQYFTKIHFLYDLTDFNKNTEKIVLPDIKLYLKKQNPVSDKKFIFLNSKKVYPDFYVDHKYAEPTYYAIDKQGELINLYNNAKIDSMQERINFVNCAKPNTKKAKKYLALNNLPTVDNVITYYKEKFQIALKELNKQKDKNERLKIFKSVAEDIGIKFVASKKFNKYFKDVSQYEVYQLRKFLGVKLFEHYDGIVEFNETKLNKLQKLYTKILSDPDKVLSENISLKILKEQIEIIK